MHLQLASFTKPKKTLYSCFAGICSQVTLKIRVNLMPSTVGRIGQLLKRFLPERTVATKAINSPPVIRVRRLPTVSSLPDPQILNLGLDDREKFVSQFAAAFDWDFWMAGERACLKHHYVLEDGKVKLNNQVLFDYQAFALSCYRNNVDEVLFAERKLKTFYIDELESSMSDFCDKILIACMRSAGIRNIFFEHRDANKTKPALSLLMGVIYEGYEAKIRFSDLIWAFYDKDEAKQEELLGDFCDLYPLATEARAEIREAFALQIAGSSY